MTTDILDNWDPTLSTPSWTPLASGPPAKNPMEVKTFPTAEDYQDTADSTEPCSSASSYSSCEGCFSHAMCDEMRASFHLLPKKANGMESIASSAPTPNRAHFLGDDHAWGWNVES